MLRREQDRIGAELRAVESRQAVLDASLHDWQEVMDLALKFSTRCATAYRRGGDRTRRLFNAAVLDEVHVRDGHVVEAAYKEPFDVLFSLPKFEYDDVVGRGSLEPGCVACSAPQDLGLVLGEVDDRCGLGAAVAGVDHRVHGVAEMVGDLPSLGHGLVLAWQQQGARDERLTEFGEQRLGHHVPGDPHPDGLLSRVLQPARYLLGRRQDEGITAWGCRLDSPEHPVADVHELA